VPDQQQILGEGRLTASRILAGQLLLTAIIAAGFAWWADRQTASSSLVGGGIGILTTAFFALRVLGGGARPLRSVVRAFYVGEAQKIVLTVALFIIAIKWLEVAFLPMFVTYMVTLFMFWFALLPAMSGGVETYKE
jgi:ATP synthase protein I